MKTKREKLKQLLASIDVIPLNDDLFNDIEAIFKISDEEILKEAKERAERVCNGNFPITYSREKVVFHTANDFFDGAKWVLNKE